jgi:hypothetical protein
MKMNMALTPERTGTQAGNGTRTPARTAARTRTRTSQDYRDSTETGTGQVDSDVDVLTPLLPHY